MEHKRTDWPGAVEKDGEIEIILGYPAHYSRLRVKLRVFSNKMPWISIISMVALKERIYKNGELYHYQK